MKDKGASLHKHREGLRRAIVLDIFQAQKADSAGRILRLSLFHDEPTNQINRRLAAKTWFLLPTMANRWAKSHAP